MLRPVEGQRGSELDQRQDAPGRQYSAPVPAIFGMNFQAVSVGQKLIENGIFGGYTDAAGDPTPNMLGEIEFVDAAIGQMVEALEDQNLLGFDHHHHHRQTRPIADRPQPLLPDSRTFGDERYVAGQDLWRIVDPRGRNYGPGTDRG